MDNKIRAKRGPPHEPHAHRQPATAHIAHRRPPRDDDRRTIALVTEATSTPPRFNAASCLAIGAAATLLAVWFIASQLAVSILFTSGMWALLWLAAACGLGWPLRRWLLPAAAEGPAGQTALGTAAMLLLDALLGRLGVLGLGSSIVAWILIVLGLLLLAEQYRRRLKNHLPGPVGPPNHLLWLALPPVAVLLLAACSAPGWLWASEFGGYDALSYHLQLPKEWLALGRIQGLEHNVYSFLPSFVEAVYYHLDLLIGDAVHAAIACQLLHAGMALITAAIVYRLGRLLAGPSTAAAATLLLLGTPWTIVTGSLAYNEMAVTLFLAGGLLILFDHATRSPPVGRGIAIGLLAGAACGSKLTAVGFVAVPLGLLLLATGGSFRRAGLAAVAAVVTAFITALPWLITNLAETGNPFFPFLTGLLGLGHWSAEQAMTFRAAHLSDLDLTGRLAQLWNQVIRYGIGPNPHPAEPWQPQWAILPWLALAGGVLGLIRVKQRPWTWRLLLILALQTAFWLSCTHLKSRFILPAIVPGAILAALIVATAADVLRAPAARNAGLTLLAILLLAQCCLPAMVFLREREGRPLAAIAATGVFTGDAHTAALDRPGLTAVEREELLDSTPPTLWINHLLGEDARVLCLGVATPFYHEPGRSVYQTTWDRGPMSRVMREAPDDPAAWLAALRRDGFTHLLVDPDMLERWEHSSPPKGGWNDPLITARRIVSAAERYATPIHRFREGVTLYRLAAPPEPSTSHGQ